MRVIDMSELICDYERLAGGHFFSKGARKFFRSRLGREAFVVGNLAYFITSEQFSASTGRTDPRRYTIRAFDYAERAVETIGDFQQYASLSIAKSNLARILKEGKK